MINTYAEENVSRYVWTHALALPTNLESKNARRFRAFILPGVMLVGVAHLAVALDTRPDRTGRHPTPAAARLGPIE